MSLERIYTNRYNYFFLLKPHTDQSIEKNNDIPVPMMKFVGEAELVVLAGHVEALVRDLAWHKMAEI